MTIGEVFEKHKGCTVKISYFYRNICVKCGDKFEVLENEDFFCGTEEELNRCGKLVVGIPETRYCGTDENGTHLFELIEDITHLNEIELCGDCEEYEREHCWED